MILSGVCNLPLIPLIIHYMRGSNNVACWLLYLYTKHDNIFRVNKTLAFSLELDECRVIPDACSFCIACTEPTPSPTQDNKVIIQSLIKKLIFRDHE